MVNSLELPSGRFPRTSSYVAFYEFVHLLWRFLFAYVIAWLERILLILSFCYMGLWVSVGVLTFNLSQFVRHAQHSMEMVACGTCHAALNVEWDVRDCPPATGALER
jgi:hypothetical protein